MSSNKMTRHNVLSLLVIVILSNLGGLLDVYSFRATTTSRHVTVRTNLWTRQGRRQVKQAPLYEPRRHSLSLWKGGVEERGTKTTTTTTTSALFASSESDEIFDGKRTATLVGGQSLLVGAAAVAAVILGTPNFGLGPGIQFSTAALEQGALGTIPLFLLAAGLDLVEDYFPALQDVTMATQRSILALLGSTLKPVVALVTSIALGLAAGFGEEMLFRGVLQYELAQRFGPYVGVGVASLVFGALHAVTPLYALLASMASVFFGFLYDSTGNLAVPIIAHAIYDIGALLWAHYTVTQMTDSERDDVMNWKGPRDEQEGGGPAIDDRTIL